MKLLSGLAIVAYAQSGDGSSDVAVDAPSMEAASAPAFRQRAISSGGNSDYEYYYEQSALGRRKKKKKKKIIFNIPQARPTTTRAPATTTRAPLPAISNDYNQLFGANGSFGSKVSADYLDYNGGSAGVAGSASDRWSGFGDSSYAYDYSDGFGEITVGNSYGGKGQFELNFISDGSNNAYGHNGQTNQFFNGSDNALGEWNPAEESGTGAHRWDNDDINKYWEYMHRQWGHQQENRLGRNFAYDPALTSSAALEEPSRWYHVAPERVINNLNRGYLNYQFPSSDGKGQPNLPHFKFPVDRRAFLQAGRHGHPWGIVPDKEWDLRIDIRDGGVGTGEGGDGKTGDGGFGRTKFGWYAQPWLWDAENVPGVSDYKLWNGANYNPNTFAQVGAGNTSQDSNSHSALQHTFGFIDWKDANKDSFANDDETGIIPGTVNVDSTEAQGIRFQDVSPARAPWYGRRFDASWELGDSPAHFVFDGIRAHGGRTPFDETFSEENKTVNYFDRTDNSSNTNNQTDQVGWQKFYSGYRWFPGIANFPGTQYTPSGGTAVSTNTPGWSNYTPNMHGGGALPENTNQVNDPAKLKCHQCIESAHLEWDDKYHTFKLVSSHSIGTTHYIARDDLEFATFGDASTADAIDHANNTNAHTKNVDLWKQCFDTIKQKSCEYSSGVCFVEERRVWGYVTQVQAGCQQAQACYMQKYQNFVVEAGRQCWPGDAFGEKHKLATRPDDMRADQWIYNIIKGGLLLAQKDHPNWAADDHRYRKFASHYFTEMENDDVAQLSSLVRAPSANNARNTINGGNTYDFRESNNWVDKFNTGFTGELDNDLSGGTHQVSRATLTDGNFGVGRSGYESAFSTLLHYPTFLNSDGRGDKFNNYIYRGGKASSDGTPDATKPYVPADIATSNQVYGMKIGDSLYNTLDDANKGQTTTFLGGANEEVLTGAGQTDGQIGTVKDLDYNGQGGADGSMFSERSQFYQNEASRFTPSSRGTNDHRTIDDQWRNPDQHNYVMNAGAESVEVASEDTEIFRQTINADSTARWNTIATSLDNIIEGKTEWTESSRYQPIEYKNGLVEASKCHQCCNTDHNCNWNWQPTTKLDWNFAYVWRYQAIDERSNPTVWDEDRLNGSSVLEPAYVANTDSMGEGGNNRNWAAGITTLSQTIQDHHFNFPPYMANHHENRGGAGDSATGRPVGSAKVMSNTSVTTFNPQGAAPAYDGYSAISPDPMSGK